MSAALGLTALQIVKFLLDNAPAELATVQAIVSWVEKTASSFYASWTKPVGSITEADLLAHLDKIKTKDDKIEATK